MKTPRDFVIAFLFINSSETKICRKNACKRSLNAKNDFDLT